MTTRLSATKRIIFNVIASSNRSRANVAFDVVITTLIVLNVTGVIFDTFESMPRHIGKLITWVDVVSVIIFTIEYLLRIWTADLLYPGKSPSRARLAFIFSFMSLVDLVSIVPFYLPIVIPFDTMSLRIVRLFRLLRVFKLERYTETFHTMGVVFKRTADRLFAATAVTGILILISSVLMFYAEHNAQPNQFRDILSSFWWAVETLTTVGYGDIYPITPFGKILAAIISVCGVGLVAMPTAIISAGFVEVLDEHHRAHELSEEVIEIETTAAATAARSPLAELADLYQQGLLTDEEFTIAKARVLGLQS